MTDYRDKGRGNDRKLTPPILLLPPPPPPPPPPRAPPPPPPPGLLAGKLCQRSRPIESERSVVELSCGYSKAEEGDVSEEYVIFIINGN